MKICFSILVSLVLTVFLSACTSPQANAASLTPTASKTQVLFTATPSATQPPPSPTAIPKQISTIHPTATQIVIVSGTEAPDKLTGSLTVTMLDAFNGHALRRLSGWGNGFNHFDWMDSSHLLLYPIINYDYSDMFISRYISYPSVIDLDSGKVWFPPYLGYNKLYGNGLPRWSASLGAIIASNNGSEINVYGPNGDLRKTYAGPLLSVSPSGTKILTAEAHTKVTWIDLISGKQMTFPSEQVTTDFQTIWSSDDTRFYTNFHVYGDMRTGKIFEMPQVILDGESGNATSLYDHVSGIWVLGNAYLLTLWTASWDWPPKFITIFDPAMKSYRNLNKLAGIPYDPAGGNYFAEAYSCDTFGPSAQEGSRYVWLNCDDGDRLIDLKTFASTTFPDIVHASLDWSADGSFAFVSTSGHFVGILSGADKKIKPLPEDADCSGWHPTKNIFICQADDGQELRIFDVQRMSVQRKVKLPIHFKASYWDIAAHKILLLASDGSLWQMSEAGLDHLEQVATPMGDIKSLRFSADGKHVALMIGADIYIVDLERDS